MDEKTGKLPFLILLFPDYTDHHPSGGTLQQGINPLEHPG